MFSEYDKAATSLSSKYIFFGHKSVGYNIINGISTLKENKVVLRKLEVNELTENERPNRPGLYHKQNGENRFPKTKCDAFKQYLIQNQDISKFDIALFKFCYVDFDNSDVQEIFNYYQQTVDDIKSRFPDLNMVHVTVPLRARTWGIKGFIKNLFSPNIANVKLNQYNHLLRERYEGKEPVWDLAKVESTRPDGSRSEFVHDGQTFYSLYKKYTYDGGHLNKLGSEIAAKEFIYILADLAGTEE